VYGASEASSSLLATKTRARRAADFVETQRAQPRPLAPRGIAPVGLYFRVDLTNHPGTLWRFSGCRKGGRTISPTDLSCGVRQTRDGTYLYTVIY